MLIFKFYGNETFSLQIGSLDDYRIFFRFMLSKLIRKASHLFFYHCILKIVSRFEHFFSVYD